MKRCNVIFLLVVIVWMDTPQSREKEPLRLVQTISMPLVRGRIDHLAVDPEGERVFVAALGNHSLEVLRMRTGQQMGRIEGLNEPQGVVYLPESNKIFVANGGDGTCKIFDGDTLQPITSINLSGDADNVRYDLSSKQLFVGYGDGGIAAVDATDGKRLGDIPLEGHPESFQLEKSGPRIFANVPKAGHVAVIDRSKRTVVATWPLQGARANFPMALDEAHHRLFVGCRQPATVVVLDTTSGQAVIKLTIARDTDDLFYDEVHKRIYVSCGEGYINVFDQLDPDHYLAVAKIATATGARTSLFAPTLDRLYLAVPRRGNQPAQIQVYAVQK